MKVALIILLIMTQVRTEHVDVQFMYPDLDSKLIDVWLDSRSKDSIKLTGSIDALSDVWIQHRSEVANEYVPHFDIKSLVMDVDQIMDVLNKHLETKNYTQIEQYAEHILWEFRNIRNCVQAEYYPLDVLWFAFDYNEELKSVIQDPMMELYEWDEFIHIYDQFKCQFQSYDLISDQELTDHFPNMDLDRHREYVRNVYICIEKLEKALQTAYQSNFVSPCDDISIALSDLIQLYRTPRYS